MTEAIDVHYLGHARVICAYHLEDGLIVDPGPSVSLAALEHLEPRALLVTHIHLDHAGGVGTLVRRHPHLKVYVHERGARHLIDPSKLLRSATMIYGSELLGTAFGEILPVPAENVVPLAGGETIEGAFRVAAVPGHASHHVAYLHEPTGDAYVGDMAGNRVPEFPTTIAPTPPPDIDVEAWLASLEVIEAWQPTAVCQTHFGRYEDVGAQLDRVREALRIQTEEARAHDIETFSARMRERLYAELDEATASMITATAPPEQLYLGLERYLSTARQ